MQELDAPDISLEPRPAGSLIPLTNSALHAWNTLHEQGTQLSTRMCAAAVRIIGELDTASLSKSIDALVRRHESLRTRIVLIDGIPRQQIDAPSEHQLRFADLESVSAAEADASIRRLAQEFIEEKIDLSVGPLFGANLYRLSRNEHVLILVLDHIVSDATSWAILGSEVWTLYSQSAQGVPFGLPPLQVQFADYAIWQERMRGPWLKKHEQYWKERLTGARKTTLPLDYAVTSKKLALSAALDFPLSAGLSASLKGLARREHTLLSLVVLSIYVALVARCCNEEDVVVGFASHARNLHPALANMIGHVFNQQLLRIEVKKEDSFLDLMKRTYQEFHACYKHHDHGWLPALIPEASTDIKFNWLPFNWARSNLQHAEVHNLTLQQFPVQSPSRLIAAGFVPLFADTIDGILMTLIYRSDLFMRETIERLGRNLLLFATECAERPHSRIASVPIEGTS